MRILAIDMGWSKSVSCLLDTDSGELQYETVMTGKEPFSKLLEKIRPQLLVIEAGPMAGWVADLCQRVQVKLLVLNTNDEPWRWRNVKKKTDRQDALKLARLAAMGQAKAVHGPEHRVRQWRQLIYYRETRMAEQVSSKKRIRAILLQEDLRLPGGAKAWEAQGLAELRKLARPMKDCAAEELWRGLVEIELKRLEQLEKHRQQVENKLNPIARGDERVRRLQQVSGVGVRTAELVVAMIDQAGRFGRARELACYAGLTPRKYQSGKMDRDGRISRAGNGLLRKYLVQAAWSGKRSEPRMQAVYERVRRNSPRRSKQAIVAVARHLLIWLWAMLRDGTHWQSKESQALQVA